MSDSKSGDPNRGMDRDFFNLPFGKNFPFNLLEKMDDLAWIEKYVQDAMTQYMPKTLSTHSQNPSRLQMEVFETHKNVIIKVHLTENEAKNVKVTAGVDRVRLEGLPDSNSKKNIKLTSHVVPESCVAVYKNGILQLHMRKQTIDDYFQEVNVKFTK
ncbi:Hsp20/alpha crystallin family protein [Cohnella sp. AR92]|uniref:Hsp20/alpha crystallin family protein n=1 Tax=Cohnella sp. AR92 TaxID=648716 RepID=UPI000F8DF12E|nr:Hsp20/alpha crystallin family protein [Cohnella sp. AR92]RUS46955.1 hypothetical protein ELR57_11145 [Cohnella sp. AR92]